MTCCNHHTGRLTTLHTPTGPKHFCPACLDSRIDMPRVLEALSDIPDYTPSLERVVDLNKAEA